MSEGEITHKAKTKPRTSKIETLKSPKATGKKLQAIPRFRVWNKFKKKKKKTKKQN